MPKKIIFDKSDIFVVVGAIGMCLLLDWDKTSVKAFIAGGVIAAWLTMKLRVAIR